jgi:hypothetical protein
MRISKVHFHLFIIYRGSAKSLARPTSRCILFDGENISFDVSQAIIIIIIIIIIISHLLNIHSVINGQC